MTSTITLVGNLVRDPQTRTVGSDKTVTSFTVAVSTREKDATTGQYLTNFYDCSAWGHNGDRVMQLGQKGSQVYVTGDFTANEYVDKNNVKRTGLRINVSNAEIIGRRKGAEEASAKAAPTTAADIGMF